MNITVTVKTNAKRTGVSKIDDENYVVSVKEEPHEGKANNAVISALSKHFHVAKTCITIKLGKTRKKKTIVINL